MGELTWQEVPKSIMSLLQKLRHKVIKSRMAMETKIK